MSEQKQLKVVMQAGGAFCLIYGMLTALAAIAQFVIYRFTDRSGMTMSPSMRMYLLQGLVHAALVLVPAWVLLAKPDWCAQSVAGMSRPQYEDEEQEEQEPSE